MIHGVGKLTFIKFDISSGMKYVAVDHSSNLSLIGHMKKSIVAFIFSCLILNVYPQSAGTYQGGINGEANLQAISNLSPNSAGAVGFDTRYEGVKGTPRLFDTLLTSYLLVKGQEKYIQFLSDLNVVNNTLLFTHPRTKQLMEVPSDIVNELIVMKEGREIKFITSKGTNFEKGFKENRFCQILTEEPYQFIKIPGKLFIKADFKGPYTIDRRFDEFRSNEKYYLEGKDKVFRQIQLNKKSLAKLFPDEKELINKSFDENPDGNTEEIVISLIRQF